MSIRKVQLAFESTYGTAAADGNQVAMPFTNFTVNGGKISRSQPRIITGTRWAFNETRKTKSEATWTAEMPLYFAMSCYPLALHFGAATVTTVFTSAKKHTFTPGGNTILSGTFQYMEVSSQNAGEWYQVTGAVADVITLGTSPEGIPMVKFDGICKLETNISAPSTVATLSIEAYDHPNNAQFSLTKAGSTYSKAQKLEWMSKQGYSPAWTLGGGLGMSRVELGDASGTIKATAFQDDYTGSLMETNAGTGLIASTGLIATWTGTDSIGTAGTPLAVITAPLPYTDDVSRPSSDKDTIEDWSVSPAYSSGIASGWTWALTNMLANTIYTGH